MLFPEPKVPFLPAATKWKVEGSFASPTLLVAQHSNNPTYFSPSGNRSFAWRSVSVVVFCLRVSSIPQLLRTQRKVVALGTPSLSHGIRLVELSDTATFRGEVWTHCGLSEQSKSCFVWKTNYIHLTWRCWLLLKVSPSILEAVHVYSPEEGGSTFCSTRAVLLTTTPRVRSCSNLVFWELTTDILQRVINKISYRSK